MKAWRALIGTGGDPAPAVAMVVAMLCLAAVAAGCPAALRGAKNPTSTTEQAVEIPPGPRAQAILDGARKQEDCATRGDAARLLFDLHDAWRTLAGEEDEISAQQRRVGKQVDVFLRRELGVQALAPRADLVGRLRLRLRALAGACPGSSTNWIATALHLMALDAGEQAEGVAAFRWATQLRRQLLSGGPLVTNARMRLLRSCARSFRHALREAPRRQRASLSRCLYGLFEADPAPYFAADPSLRPPSPPWTLLRRELRTRLRGLMRSRLSALSKLQLKADETFFKRAGAELPASVDLARLKLRKSARGRAHDDTPVVLAMAEIFIVDGLVVPRGDVAALRRAFRKRLRGDQRGALTVVMSADGSAGAIYELGRAAQREKVHTLLLGVRRMVARRAAPGDVQATMAGKGPVWRLEGIPVSVRLLSLRPGETDRDRPRALLYDPLAAEARLALVCTGKTWRIESRYGALPALRAGDVDGLRRQLVRIQRVFPDEGGVILAAAYGLTFAQLVQVVEVVRYAGRAPLFPAVALAQRYGLASGAGSFEGVLKALEGARVEPATALAAPQKAALLACCRRALARAFRAEEVLATLETGPSRGRAKARGGTGAGSSVGAAAWGTCLSASQRAAKTTLRCVPGGLPARPGDKKSKP